MELATSVLSLRVLFAHRVVPLSFLTLWKTATAKPLVTQAVGDRRAELHALKGRIVIFHQGLINGEEVSLGLTPDDINLAIDAFDTFRDLR